MKGAFEQRGGPTGTTAFSMCQSAMSSPRTTQGSVGGGVWCGFIAKPLIISLPPFAMFGRTTLFAISVEVSPKDEFFLVVDDHDRLSTFEVEAADFITDELDSAIDRIMAALERKQT